MSTNTTGTVSLATELRNMSCVLCRCFSENDTLCDDCAELVAMDIVYRRGEVFSGALREILRWHGRDSAIDGVDVVAAHAFRLAQAKSVT